MNNSKGFVNLLIIFLYWDIYDVVHEAFYIIV